MIIKKEESTDYTVVSAIFYFTQQPYLPVLSSVQNPQAKNLQIKFQFISLSFLLEYSGSGKLFLIRPDPDPQNWLKRCIVYLFFSLLCIGQSLEWKVLRAILQNHFGLVYKQPELRKIRIRLQGFAARIQILKLANCKITF